MPKLAEQEAYTPPLADQLRWSLWDLRNGMLPYFPLRPRDDGLIHAAFHWTQFPQWLRTITGR